MAGHIHCHVEAGDRTIDDAAVQIVTRREGDRVQQKIQTAPGPFDPVEHFFQLPGNLNVTGKHELTTQPTRHRADERLRLGVQIGGCKARAGPHECFGAASRDTVLVRDSDHEAALPAKIDQARSPARRCVRHRKTFLI